MDGYRTEEHIASITTADYARQYRDTERFLSYCHECRMYGNCWTCPPFRFDTDAVVRQYRHTLIIVTKVIPETEGIPQNDVCETVERLIRDCRQTLDSRLLALENRYGGRAFFAGNCKLCSPAPCSRTRSERCIHADMARPSLESFGFDLMRTAQELCGVKMLWSDGKSLPPYITLVSGFMHNTEGQIIW